MTSDNLTSSAIDRLTSGLEAFSKFGSGFHFAGGIAAGLAMRSASPVFLTAGLLTGMYAQQNFNLPKLEPYVTKGTAYAVDFIQSFKK